MKCQCDCFRVFTILNTNVCHHSGMSKACSTNPAFIISFVFAYSQLRNCPMAFWLSNQKNEGYCEKKNQLPFGLRQRPTRCLCLRCESWKWSYTVIALPWGGDFFWLQCGDSSWNWAEFFILTRLLLKIFNTYCVLCFRQCAEWFVYVISRVLRTI